MKEIYLGQEVKMLRDQASDFGIQTFKVGSIATVVETLGPNLLNVLTENGTIITVRTNDVEPTGSIYTCKFLG